MRATIFDGRTATAFTAADARGRAPDAAFAWIDVRAEGSDDHDAAELLRALGIGDLEVAAALRTGVAGTFQAYGAGIVAVTWAADPDVDGVVEVHLAWDPTRLITVRFGGDHTLTTIQHELARRSQTLFAHPPTVFGIVLQLLLASVDRRLTRLRERLDETDEAIIEQPRSELLGDLRAIRRSMVPMARRFPSYADTLQAALVDPSTLPGMDDNGVQHLRSYVSECNDTLQRLNDLADGLRSAVQDYQTEMGSQQGNRIDQLTIVSIIFLPITFLTGYFGMNFQWLDNQLESFASWFLLGALVPIAMLVGSVLVLASRGYSLRFARRPAPRSEAPVLTASGPASAAGPAVSPGDGSP